MPLINWVITSTVLALSAANKVVVLCRVVVRPPFNLPRLHRQQRLGAIKRLNLRHLIDAEDRRMGGRFRYTARRCLHLLDQERIVTTVRKSAPVRLYPKHLPNPVDGHATEPDGPRYVPCSPVGRAARRRFQCPDDHLLDLVIGDRPHGAGPRFVRQAVQALPDEAPRHLQTDTGVTWSRCATTLLSAPSAHAKMIAPPCHVAYRLRAMRERIQSSPSVSVKINATLGRRVRCSLPCKAGRTASAICFSFDPDKDISSYTSDSLRVPFVLPSALF